MMEAATGASMDARAQSQELLLWRARYASERAALLSKAHLLTEIERDVQGFLEQYYAAIAQDIEALFALESIRTDWLQQQMPKTFSTHQRSEHEGREAKQRLTRDTYRKAVRNVHPDTGRGSTEQVQHVNRARDEGDVAQLIRFALPDAPASASDIATWSEATTALMHLAGEVETTLNQLMASPAYALYLKAFEARLAGRDWMEDMTHKIRRSIAHETRAIAKDGVEKIAAWRVA